MKHRGECGGGNESASRAPAAGGRGAPPPGEDGAKCDVSKKAMVCERDSTERGARAPTGGEGAKGDGWGCRAKGARGRPRKYTAIYRLSAN